MFRSLAALVVLVPSLAIAQESDPQVVETQEIKYKERTEIVFDGISLKGDLVGPSGSVIAETQRPVFNPLIKIRSTFDREMTASVDEVK